MRRLSLSPSRCYHPAFSRAQETLNSKFYLREAHKSTALGQHCKWSRWIRYASEERRMLTEEEKDSDEPLTCCANRFRQIKHTLSICNC